MQLLRLSPPFLRHESARNFDQLRFILTRCILRTAFFGRGRHPRHSHGLKGGTPAQGRRHCPRPGGQTLSGTVSPQPRQRPEPLCGAADADFYEPKGNFWKVFGLRCYLIHCLLSRGSQFHRLVVRCIPVGSSLDYTRKFTRLRQVFFFSASRYDLYLKKSFFFK